MRKRWLVLALAALTMTSVTACGKGGNAEPSENYESYSEDYNTGVEDEYVESTEDITEASVEEETGMVKISDIKEDTLNRTITQAQNGFRQLCLAAGMTNVDYDILNNRENLFSQLGITEEELLKLTTEEELSDYLMEKGMTEDQIYSFSIYSYLLDALNSGDEAENKEGYLTKTRELLAVNELDFDKLINSRNFSELKTHVEESGLSLYELNCKLWINDIFPGVDIDAAALMDAPSPEAFLAVFTDADVKLDELSEKAADPNKAKELLDTLKTIEKESLEAEESKSATTTGGSTGSGTGTGGTTAQQVKESLAEKETETIPDNGGENSVTIIIGNDGGTANTKKDDDDEDSGSGSSNTKGTATIKVGDKEERVRIIVKKILRDERAISEINASNSNLPGMIDVDKTPDDYEWVAVKFTVRRIGDSSSTDNVNRPLVRVKNMSGANIEEVATHVYYIEPESSAETDGAATYWVAFMIPENQSKYMLYFGDTSGSVYKFKSTALEEDD